MDRRASDRLVVRNRERDRLDATVVGALAEEFWICRFLRETLDTFVDLAMSA